MKRIILFFIFLMISGSLPAESDKVSVENFLFTVECDDGSCGSAFLMKDNDGVWMVSNYHVISGTTNVEFISLSDSKDKLTLPEEIEIASDRDAVRFKVDRDSGFTLAEGCSFDDVVFAYGNSGGLGVITKSEGTVVGKGRRDVEVSCEIIPGNSGGPVINDNHEVVGVASYIVKPAALELSGEMMKNLSTAERSRLEQKLKEVKGTRYEGTRRFAIPVNKITWQPMPLADFAKESKTFEDEKVLFSKMRKIISLAFEMTRSISEDVGKPFIKERWIRQYNREVPGSLSHYGSSYYIKSGTIDGFYRQYSRSLFDLHDHLQEALDGQMAEAQKNLTVEFFLKDISEQQSYVDDSLTALKAVAEGCKR